MKKFLLLFPVMAAMTTCGFADEIEEITETLEQKVAWAQNEGEKFEAIGDVAEDTDEKDTHYKMAMNFYNLEKEYLDEYHIMKFLAQIKREFEDACECSYDDEEVDTPESLRRNAFVRFIG